MNKRKSTARYVVCIENDGYPESLELRKLYRLVPDAAAKKVDFVRVVDESGEDYLYPSAFFVPVTLPAPVKRALAKTS